jgi:hypothetical protein
MAMLASQKVSMHPPIFAHDVLLFLSGARNNGFLFAGFGSNKLHFFNTDAFVDQLPFGPQYRYGNSARNTVIGPGIVDFVASVNKLFPVREYDVRGISNGGLQPAESSDLESSGRQLSQPDNGVITSTRIDCARFSSS